MSKKSPLPQSRHHVMIYNEDWEWLQAAYGQGQTEPGAAIGAGTAIKTVVHAYVQRLKARAEQKIDAGGPMAQEKELSNG